MIPSSGRYTPTRLEEIVRDTRRDPSTTAAVCAEHGFSGEEWREINRRFDIGEMWVTRLQVVRSFA